MAQTLPSSRAYAAWLAVFRLYMGLFWLVHGVLKISGRKFARPDGAMVKLVSAFAAKTSGPYHDFLVRTVLPHAALFAQLVQVGETLAGVSLLLGLFTRFGGFVGAFLALNYWAAKGSFGLLSDVTALEILTAAASLVNVVLPTGRVFGLDGVLAKRR